MIPDDERDKILLMGGSDTGIERHDVLSGNCMALYYMRYHFSAPKSTFPAQRHESDNPDQLQTLIFSTLSCKLIFEV